MQLPISRQVHQRMFFSQVCFLFKFQNIHCVKAVQTTIVLVIKIVSAAIIFQMSIIVPFQLAYTLRIKMSKD